MDGIGYRVAVARGLDFFARVADDLLSSGSAPVRERDAAACRELIRDAVHRMHQRSARSRPIVSRRS